MAIAPPIDRSASLAEQFSSSVELSKRSEMLLAEIEEDGNDAGPAGLLPVPQSTQDEDVGVEDEMTGQTPWAFLTLMPGSEFLPAD